MSRPAEQVLQLEFHAARAKILELAATLDRLDRCNGSVENQAQYQLLQQGIALLHSKDANRAEQLQLLMSRPYDPAWQANLQVRPQG